MMQSNVKEEATTGIAIEKLKLPTVSGECLKILDMLSAGDVEIHKLSKIVALDPVLSSSLIKYANSPLYRRSKEVTNVNLAVSLLGIKNVTAAVMMATMKSFAKNQSTLDDLLWQHSVTISVLCKIIASKKFPEIADEAELIGLLHDMGAMILSTNYPDVYEAHYNRSLEDQVSLDQLEKDEFGYNRDDVMLRVAAEFRLPEEITQVICTFHNNAHLVNINSNVEKFTAILSFAHFLESRHEGDVRLMETINGSFELLAMLLGFTDDELENLIEDCEEKINERFDI